jgi:hypothetical protein
MVIREKRKKGEGVVLFSRHRSTFTNYKGITPSTETSAMTKGASDLFFINKESRLVENRLSLTYSVYGCGCILLEPKYLVASAATEGINSNGRMILH